MLKKAILLIAVLGLGTAAAEDPVGPAWLGVWVSDAVDGSVEIVAIAPDGPAQRAGLARGDIVLEAGGVAVRREEALGHLLLGRRPGEALELVVLRAGEAVTARVELGRRPERIAAAPPVPEAPRARWEAYRAYTRARTAAAAPFGVQAVAVTPALRAHFGAPGTSGVLVTRVEPGRIAAHAGLRVGDVLLSIDETEITDAARLREVLTGWDRVAPLEARIVRAGEPQLLRVSAPPQAGSPAEPWREAIEQVRAEQRKRERDLLERRLLLEIERLERRIEELRRNVKQIREDR